MAEESLVLFYSWKGNTRKIARLIAQKTGANFEEDRTGAGVSVQLQYDGQSGQGQNTSSALLLIYPAPH